MLATSYIRQNVSDRKTEEVDKNVDEDESSAWSVNQQQSLYHHTGPANHSPLIIIIINIIIIIEYRR